MQPFDALDVGAGTCPGCGEAWRLDYAHSIGSDSPLLTQTAAGIGIAENDIIVGRLADKKRCFLRLGEPADLFRAEAAA